MQRTKRGRAKRPLVVKLRGGGMANLDAFIGRVLAMQAAVDCEFPVRVSAQAIRSRYGPAAWFRPATSLRRLDFDAVLDGRV